MGKTMFPLEGSNIDSVQFFLYEGIGREVWGVVRVRREKNPDTLVVEVGKGRDPKIFSPFVKFAPIGEGMAFLVGQQFLSHFSRMKEANVSVRPDERSTETGKTE